MTSISFLNDKLVKYHPLKAKYLMSRGCCSHGSQHVHDPIAHAHYWQIRSQIEECLSAQLAK